MSERIFLFSESWLGVGLTLAVLTLRCTMVENSCKLGGRLGCRVRSCLEIKTTMALPQTEIELGGFPKAWE